MILSAEDGRTLAQYPINQPMFDGMIAADGRLYVAMQDGNIVCYAKP